MKHIYIFNVSSSRAGNYGVGTYVKQLINILNHTEYKVTIVNIIDKDIAFDIWKKNAVRYITIPAPVINKNNLDLDLFEKSIPFILHPYINKNEKNIFHLNYMGSKFLAEYLRLFLGGSTILTVHYTDWSFSLLGNLTQLQRILKKEDAELDTQSRTISKKLQQEKELLDTCDKLISISKHSYHNLIKIHKADKNKISLISNALKDSYNKSEEKKLAIRRKLQIDPDEMILLFVGRLDSVKGIHILIKSFKHVIEKHPKTHMFIAGEGELNKCISESSPVWAKISFTGFLSEKNIQELYHIANIGIIPSLHEEFGYVAIEMMSHKIPVVVNDTTGLSEIIDDQINGLKVSVNSQKKTWRELTNKINYLIENQIVREKIGENARKKFKTQYNLKLFKKRMLSLYDSL